MKNKMSLNFCSDTFVLKVNMCVQRLYLILLFNGLFVFS